NQVHNLGNTGKTDGSGSACCRVIIIPGKIATLLEFEVEPAERIFATGMGGRIPRRILEVDSDEGLQQVGDVIELPFTRIIYAGKDRAQFPRRRDLSSRSSPAAVWIHEVGNNFFGELYAGE